MVRTTMARDKLGVSPTACIKAVSYSRPGGCYGKGERKYRFEGQGGATSNSMAIYVCCLPVPLVTAVRKILEEGK